MRIVYVGAADGLAAALAEYLTQEGHEMCLISDKPLQGKRNETGQPRFIRMPRDGENYARLLRSLSPDCVIFSGDHYADDPDPDGAESDVVQLGRTLRAVSGLEDMRLVLLSSTEVYGNTGRCVSETAECDPNDERAMRFLREEQLVDLYRRRGMDAAILRVSQLYTSEPKEGDPDFLSRCFAAVRNTECTLPAPMYQPLHVADLANAVRLVIDAGADGLYNVTGSARVTARRLIEMVCDHEGIEEQPVQWENPTCITLADSAKIRDQLGWEERHSLERGMAQGASSTEEIQYSKTKESAQDDRGKPSRSRQIVQNVLLFAVFAVLAFVCRGNPVFSQMHWLLLYVTVAAVSCSVPQAVLVAALASGASLAVTYIGMAEPAGAASVVGSTLAIAEYFFVGVFSSHAMSKLRARARDREKDLRLLREDYQDLMKVNEENELVRQDYQERLLASDKGLPQLYSLISRLMVAEPDRILMETMRVISEMVDTSTVAVYQARAGSPWLRLVAALNEDSAMDGKSWNLSDAPQILDAMNDGELYQGRTRSGDPAVVMPVMYQGSLEAVVLIRKLSPQSETPYHISLLKTLSLLLGDTMEKALQYEELSRATHYLEGTDILKPEFFRDRVMLAREMWDMDLAEYCVVELKYPGTLEEANAAMSGKLRTTDCLGTNRKGQLFALLNNTGPDNIEHLRKRLQAGGVDVIQVDDTSMWI